jgi:uncharacterized cupredoxin-like copper-binding protein
VIGVRRAQAVGKCLWLRELRSVGACNKYKSIKKEQLTTMKHIRVIGLVLVALFAMATAATSALAAPEHIYKVGNPGKKLEAKETREIAATAKTEFILKGTDLGQTSETKCKKLKLNAADDPVIVGGEPGRSEREDIVFEECKAKLGSIECSSVVVESALANNELVTTIKPTTGKEASLFTPASGKVFTKIKLTCGIIKITAEVTGNTAALISPEKTIAKAGTLIWNEKEPITEIEKQNKTKETIGLKFAGSTASINGESEVTLTNGEEWGAF